MDPVRNNGIHLMELIILSEKIMGEFRTGWINQQTI